MKLDVGFTDSHDRIRAPEKRARPPTPGDLGESAVDRVSWRNPRARETIMVTNPFEMQAIPQPQQQVPQPEDRRSS